MKKSRLLPWFRVHLRVPCTCLLLGLFSVWATGVHAATGTWILNNAGNWTGVPANWQDGVIPNAIGDVAIFRNDITTNRSVTLNAPITLGGLVMGDLLGGQVFTFAGNQTLTLNNTTGNAFVTKLGSATDVWQAPLLLTDSTDWNIHTGTLDVNGVTNATVSYGGAGDTIKNGAGALRLNINAASALGNYTGNWIVNFGTLNLGGNNGDSNSLGEGTGGIILNGTGRQDLAVFSLNNNGSGSDTTVNYAFNSDVYVRGGAALNVDRNFIGGANDRVTHVLNALNFDGGVLRVTAANSHMLRFAGNTTLTGQTNVFDILGNGTATLANLTLAGDITDGLVTRSLIKEGAGRMAILSTTNTYDGVTAVKNGILQLGPNANLGSGRTFVNGGVLSVPDTATLNGVTASGGVTLVGQLGTSRFSLPVIGYSGSATLDAANPLNFAVPVSGAILAVDGVTGTASVSNANIDLSSVGSGSQRVWLSNAIGFDRSYRGTLTNGPSGDLRLLAPANTLILDTTTNLLGGAGATNNLVFGHDLGNAILFTGSNFQNVNGAVVGGTFLGGGTVSVRVNNANTLGAVTVNRGVTLNINGNGLTTPVGAGVVTALGGTISTDNASTATFGNTDFRLYGGSTLLLDNSAVTTNNTDRRLLSTTDINLTSSTLRIIGDGSVAVTSSQAVNSIDYNGGSTLSIDTDSATAATRLTSLTAATLNRTDRGTLNLRNISNIATTFGTATGTQKLILTSAPTVTNGMVGANIALWGGANANDGSQPLFVTYDGTHGIQAATFNLSGAAVDTAAELAAATATQVVSIDALTANMTVTTGNVQALRIRTTANTNQQVNTGTITIGASAGLGQGAGLYLAHTSDNENTHSANFTFAGGQEGLIYTSTTGGSSIVRLNGNITGTNGLTTFGNGVLRLGGTNNFGGPLTINAGQVRLASVAAGGPVTGSPTEINLWGGMLFLGSSQRFNNNANFYNDARFGNDNVGGSMLNNMSVQPRVGSTAPVVVYVQNPAGGNFTTVNGTLNMAGPGQFSVVHALQVNGGLTGSGNLDKFMNERFVIAGDSTNYTGNITAYAGVMQSYTASPTAKPFGSGNTVTIQPGAHIVLAAPTNIQANQVTINSDHGGISTIGQFYVADPATTLPAIAIQSSAPWKVGFAIGAVGFSQDIDQSTLFGGNAYLGAVLGHTGIFTGNLTPSSTGYLLGTSQGTLRIEKPLTGNVNAVIGISMTGTSSRADQFVNNSGGVVQYDVPMTYTGNTILNPGPIFRVSARNALDATGNLVLAGGQLRVDPASAQNRMIAPISISNTMVMTADTTIQMENSAYDLRLGGNIQLAPGSTGVVRAISIGSDQPGAAANNAGMVYLDGGISDGVGGSGNHLLKNGVGTMFFTGTNTYTGTTTIQQGLIGINADSDWGLTTGTINAPGGGIAIWENSFTTAKNYSAHGGNLHVDVAGGLTLTQDAASVIDGTSSIVKRGLGTLVLNGGNAVSGLFAGDGILQFNSLVSTANSASTGNYSIGGDVALGGANNNTRYTGGTMRFNFTGTTTRGFVFNNNGNTNFSGGIDVTAGNTLTAGGVISQGTELDFGFITGPGTLITTANNTWRGVAMTNGVLQFANSTPWANSTGTAADNTFVEMLGGTIRAVNTGANIALANNLSTTTYNYGGGMILSMGSGTGFSVELAADNLLRVNQGTLVLQTEGSTSLGGVGNINTARVIVTNAVNASLARGSALTNGIFPAHLIGANATGAGFFLQNDAATGFVPYSGAANASLSGAAPTAIGDISSTQSLAGLNSIYALRTTADITGGILNVTAIDNLRSGGILINGSNTIASGLVFDPTLASAPGAGTPGEGLVYVKSGENALISGNIVANAFTKFGAGSLTLGGSNQIAGDVSVQSGTLRLGSGLAFSRMNTELNINSGATLDLNGYDAVVETLGANNRLTATAAVGGTVTNASATPSTLSISGPVTATSNGVLSGNLKLLKAGIGTLTLNGYSASTPNAGVNTHTGGTDIYGYNTTGGLTLNNTTTALGGGAGGAPTVNLYSGTLSLLFSNGTTGINGTQGMQFNNQVVRIGADASPATLNVFGPALLNVNVATPSSNTAFGQGNILTFGAMNLSNTTMQVSGGNLYRIRAEGPITIQGSQAAIQTNSDGPNGALELTGVISGAGALTKLGNGTLRGIVVSNPANTYSGGTNIVAGDVQVTATTGTPLGTGPVRVFPFGTLRLAGNGSVNGANLTTMSRVDALGVVMLDGNFNPTVLNSSNFSSLYNTALQLGEPYFTQPLNMSAIGDGRAFLGTGLNAEVAYVAATLGAGVPEPGNPGVGVFRLAPGSSSFAFSGVDNVLSGNNYLQVGPQRNNVLGAITNGGSVLVIRNSNNYSAGSQITKGASIYIETGGRATGESPLGSGPVEVYGELRIRGAQGSLWNASTSAATNVINLRPGGIVRLHDTDGSNAFQFVGAGNQGRWGDNVGIDLNGGIFIYNGAVNLQSTETIGAVTARKAGQLQIFRNSTASAATLAVSDISRAERGVLTLAYNTGFLGNNVTTPLSFERITTGSIQGAAIVRGGTTTNGSGVTNGGMVVPWIIDRTANTFLGYDPSGAGTGFQPLLSAAPGAGQLAYNQIVTGATFGTGIGANDIVDLTTAAKTLNANPSFYALRSNQNISPNGANNTLTLGSGGLILTGGTINPLASGVVGPMTLNFGAAGAGEAFIFNGVGTSNIYAQINAAQGLTKFGPNQLSLLSINPGIGAPVVVNEGTLLVRVPFSGSGSPVGQVLNSQDVILNSGGLALEPFIANAAGTASEIASSVRAQAVFDSDIFVRGDAALGNNSQAQYARIADLTIANSAGSVAATLNSTITLQLQSGLWVRGTTTLAQEARINSTFNGFSQSTLAGQVTGAGGMIKFGNGAVTMMDPTNNYAGGTVIWGTTNATAVSTVASAYRGVGTPFSTGDIQIQPGGMLRVADNANIASNAVYLRSDGAGLGGIALAHNGVLPSIITAGTPAAGQIKVESTGPFDGVLALDYGFYSRTLNPATVASGNWWVGNSQQNDAYYFNSTIGASANGKYLLGGGGNQGSVQFGSVLVSAGRTSLFENVFSGGTAGQVRMEIGAQTGDFAWNSPSFINGNSGYVALTTRNAGLVGDVRVNTNTVLGLGNNYALGNGRLILNGGSIRSDIGNNNLVSTNITLNNAVVLQGDLNTTAGTLVLRGNVAMSDVVGAGATRIWNMAGGDLAVRGIISGAPGSNLIKRGASSLTLSGANTYQGYTQIDRGTVVVAGDVLPGAPGPLGMSNSPIILGVESANNSGSLGIGGQFVFARDIQVVAAAGTGVNLVESRTFSPATVTGGISVATGTVLSLGSAGADVATFRGGQLDLQGAISGSGAVVIGTTAVAPANGGTVRLGGGINGYGGNTYAGGTTLHSARIQLNGTSYFTGPANNPSLIISGPLGTGPITFGSGETNRGAFLEAFGGPVTIVNALNAISHANTLNLTFGGNQALTFTRNLDLNSDATLRTRSFVVRNLYQPVTFSGNISNAGVQGGNLVKSGPGMLVLTGTNTQANLLTTDSNYGTGVFIDAGILRVNSNAALGSTATLTAAGSHVAGPADVRLRGGYLSVTSGFSTDRQFILSNSSGGIDVAAGQTLTLTKVSAGAFNLRKVGDGNLALNPATNGNNTIATLTIGGGQQLNPAVGFTSHRGGTVSTTNTAGSPFATTAVTIEGGALALVGGATAQALTVPTVNYGANAAIVLSQGTTTTTLTATALTRAGAFNSVNYGTLTVVPSALANLGGSERLLTSTASLNTTTGAGDILTVPSIFVRLQAAGSDANFARYDAVNGVREHNVTTVATLASAATANVADISTADTAGTGNIDIQAIRTTANIAPADGTTLLRIARGGLIFNGNTASTVSANTLFGTGAGASLTEAIVYVRENQTGASAISGTVTARDFTKTGPGTLELSSLNNQLNSNAVRLPVLSVQNGTLRFASAAASFQNQARGPAVGDLTGHYVLNVNEAGVFDLNGLNLTNGGLNGNGTVTSSVAGAATLTVRNGSGVNTTFNGLISDGAGTVSLVKSQNGILTLSGHSTYTGGTVIQSGRVTNATGSTVGNGQLEAQTVTALGNGPVILAGGNLRLNAANLLNDTQAVSEVINGIDFLRWGGVGGLNVTVAATAFANGVALPANTTSYLNASTQNAGINNLTVDAPMLTIADTGLVQVNGTTSFSQANTVLRTAGGRLYLAGRVDAAGKTLTKTGANDLVLTNGASGAGQNQAGLWVVSGGLLEARTSLGASNPFGSGSTVEINLGNNADARGLRLLSDSDGTNNSILVNTFADLNVRFGSMLPVSSNLFVASGSNRLAADRVPFIGNNSFKTLQINNLEVGGALGSPQVYFVLGNNDSLWVNGTTTFLRDMQLQVDGGQGLVLNGLISGNGTLNRRSNGGTLYINADNSVAGGYNGGTFFTGGGRNYLGSIVGNQVALSDTAKLGKGHVWLGPLASFQINSAGNLQADQNFYISGNLSWGSRLSLAADLSLEQVRLRSNGLGGIQDSATDYFLSGRNPSSAILALGTVYTQPLDLGALGDGMWYLGSMTNGIGANGAYEAATLKPGLGDTYRLGAGGNTLFFGTSGAANVLTDVNATRASQLVIGYPMTVQNSAPLNDGTGAVVLLQNQNYTGSTLINRSSTLDFRGTLATSGIETYGVLNVAGEAGTLFNSSTGNPIPVTLRPGSTVRLDNTTAGVLPTSATEGRWKDNVGLSMTNSILRLQGNAAVEVVETVGAIDVVSGANRLDVVRGVIGRGTELRTPSITRTGFGTLQLNTNGSQLGSDERILITGTAPTVTNGMVAPWIINNNDIQFVTYNSDIGYTNAGFDRVQAAATLAATVTAPNDRTYFSGAVVLNAGVDFDTYALRLDGNVTLGTAADSTAQLILRSGGLLSNSTRTITAGIQAGSAGTSELLLFNTGTTTVGDWANPNTAGLIAASGITKFGAGNLQLLGNNPGFTGDIRVQQGTLEFNYRNTANVATEVATTIGGNGGNVIFEGAGSILNLRGGQDGTNLNFTGNTVTFSKGIVMGDYVPTATISVDRSAGTGATSQNKMFILTGGITFGQNNGDVGQVLRVDGRNGIRLQVNGTTTLNGRSSFAVENGYSGTAADLFLNGKVTGAGTLVKGPADSKGRNLHLFNLVSLNDFSGGTVLQGGTLQAVARAANGAANTNTNLLVGGIGTGPITLMQGTLDLRVDSASSGAADTELEFVRYTGSGIGQDVIVKGSSGINVDRTNLQGYYTRTAGTVVATIPEGHGYQVGQSVTVTNATGATGTTATNFTLTAVTANTITYTDGTASSTGLFAVQQNSGTTKMITFNNLSVGSEILTITGGNAYGVAFAGTTTLLGNAFVNNNTDVVLGGAQGATGAANSIVTDGGQVLIHKINSGTLWVHSTNNNLTGPTYVNAGLLAFGNRAVGNNTATLGTGNIYVNPGAGIQVRATTNINTGLGQKVVLTGTQYSPAVFRSTFNITQAQLEAMIQPSTPSTTQNLIFAHEGNLTESYNMATVGNGRLFIGASADRSYTGASVSPGLPNLPNSVVGGLSTNPVHRFTHISGNTLTINLSGAGNIGDVGGATDVQIGSLASLGVSNFNTGFVYFQDQNTYTGQTVVSRGLTLRFNTAMAAGNTAGPLGANASSLIDIYGGLRFEGTGNLFQNGSTTDHFYTGLRFRPGSTLTFQDMTATGVASNRWGDSVPLELDGAAIVADATNNANDNAETIGAITFDRGSRIVLAQEGTGDAFLTAASVTRAAAGSGAGTGRGTLVFQTTASTTFGVAASAGVAQTQFRSTAAITPSATAVLTGAQTNMLPGYYMESQGNRFVKNGANGITPVLDGDMVAMPSGAGLGTEVVNITATTTMGSFETSIFALRGGAFTLNSPTGANNDATITLTGSGADVGAVASFGAFVINPNLKFGANGTNEGIFYTGSTLTVNGNVTAGSITKYGTGGTLVIANDQSDAARGIGNGYQGGWVVNEGNLQLGQFGSAGNAHVNNTIVLNGAQAASAQLNLRAAPGDTLLNYTYSSGRIIAVDNATIDWDPGVDDRVHTIADVEIQQSGGIGNGPVSGTVNAVLRIANNRSRSILAAGSLTVTNHAILNVDTTAAGSPFAAYAGNGSYLTNGLSSGFSVASLIGSQRLTKWGDGTMYVRGDSSATFSGTLVIDQGAVHVSHNGALGTGPLIINRYGTLEIGVANFSATNSSVTYNEGSIERWSVDSARGGSINLGKATLQIAANQPTTNASVTLDGGAIAAFLRNDDVNGAQGGGGVMRILNPNVSFTLNSNSFIGTQYYLGANGLDNGKQAMDNISVAEYAASGAILEVQGSIGGAGGLTKVGYDTVILSGGNTYAGGTSVEGGRLLLGRDNALPVTTALSTTANGVMDLNGQDQTVGALVNPVITTAVNATSGFITNSATAIKTLTVGNGAASPFTYSGVIQHNVALTKTGTATMTLTNANTYRGPTYIAGGILALAANATIHDTPSIRIGNGARFDVSSKASYTFDGAVIGGGLDVAGTTYLTAVNAGRINGNLVLGDNLGAVGGVGTLSPGNSAGHLYTNGNLNLNGQLTGTLNTSVTRLTLEITTPTINAYSLGAFNDTAAWLVANAANYLTSTTGFGDYSGHDYVNVGGELTVNQYGRVVVSNLGGTFSGGDVFNLLDWTTLTNNGFTVNGVQYDGSGDTGFDLDLPTLPSGLFWDASLFTSHGVLFVVPEPGKMLLVFLGLLGLCLRRRR